ncbi:MAG: hypothetical protein IKZ08_02520 [Bacteroidales bacterium]|nr:hypothetical protein [Bacteroidales bacterium]
MVKQVEFHGFLYSRWGGVYEVLEGTIRRNAYSRDHGTFTTGRPKYKRRQCSVEPGVVFNASVWLPERDDDKARKLLMEYEWQCILRLQKKIEQHTRNMACLEGDPLE